MNDVFLALKARGIPFTSPFATSQLCSYRGGGPAQAAVRPATFKDFSGLCEVLRETHIPYLIAGGFTNVLITDEGCNGLLVLTDSLKGVYREGNKLTAGAAEKLPYLAAKALRERLSGLEPLSGIPATVGGAICMNAGSFGTSIAELLRSVTVLHLPTGKVYTLRTAEIPFGYRTSGRFFADSVIISAEFVLTEGRPEDIDDALCRYRKMRTATQPAQPSLGCVFRNAENGLSAGYYLDKAGMKGKKKGGAEVSEKHANFIVNTGGGTAADYISLMQEMKTAVIGQFGITLRSEIKIYGRNAPPDL